MLTFDLHYHTNVYLTRQATRKKRLMRHLEIMKLNKLDFVASTEHGYKAPLDAWLYLVDVAKDLPTQIIPGVEAVAKEGVDIIFLYQNEADFKNGLKSLEPFHWSVWDMKNIAQATNAISIIAHPFTPGTSGIVTQAGVAGLRRLLPDADYVEAHNGSGLFLMRSAEKNPTLAANKTLKKVYQQKARFTEDLPRQFLGGARGATISSDAHFPEHQLIVGAADIDEDQRDNWFDVLKQRPEFSRYFTARYHDCDLNRSQDRRTLAMMQCILGEAIYKKRLKTLHKFNRSGS
jgi:hypothetical protein